MRVKFTKEMKGIVTVSELPAVREVLDVMKEDAGLKEYAATAARIAARSNTVEILKAEAEIAKNRRVFNRYSDISRDFDIWLTVYAFDAYKGFYTIGAYLSDIWDSTGENSEELRSYMYIREYTENK